MTLIHRTVGTLAGAYVLLAAFGVAEVAVASSASVTNSVSVHANGGESHTTVHTTINGEVVEDISVDSDEDIEYSSHIEAEGEDVVISTSSNSLQATSQLKALVAKLRALIELYEKLLRL